MATDYYTTELLHQIWPEDWYNGLFRNSRWFNNATTLDPIAPQFQSYHPYACHACKRGSLTNTNLSTCTGCRVVKYCCRGHQKADWKNHRAFCKAFTQVRQEEGEMTATTKESWHSSAVFVTGMLSSRMEITKHSSDIQIPFLQPHCRKCYKAGSQCELVVCPRCGGVALCKNCIGDNKTTRDHTAFHFETDDATKECNSHLVSLCCMALVVEQGNPLGMPCLHDAASYWRPANWIEYFHQKKYDYEIPGPMFTMAPVPAFFSDAHSTVLTIQHVLGLSEVDHDTSSSELFVHICGAALNDEMMTGRYVEIIRLNPHFKRVELHLIGPKLSVTTQDVKKVLALERIRSTCSFSIHCHHGLYHEVASKLERPSVVFCMHSGLHEPGYTEDWKPTMEYLNEENRPLILTGYNHEEVVKDHNLMLRWGARPIVPPTPNPFRGLRPFLDPGRDPNDVVFTNSSFVVYKGKE